MLVFIKTYGCTLNKRDSEDLLAGVCCETTCDYSKLQLSRIVIVNTCGVKEQTETKIHNFLENLKRKNINPRDIYIYGCLVDINSTSLRKIIPDAHYFRVSDKKILYKKLITLLGKTPSTDRCGKKQITKIIAIANGCLGNCTYCAVKIARGRLKSRPIKEIFAEINDVVKKGCKEILLTAQDTGCYGLDINTNIIELLTSISKLPGDFKVRLGMMNPQHIKSHLVDLCKILNHSKFYKFIHIPLQSGNKNILTKMNRQYTPEDFAKIINTIKKSVSNITISTDIIVGFPGETQKQFEDTLKLIKRTRPDNVNISRFGKRKGTVACKMQDLSGNIKKQRSRALTILCHQISKENHQIFKGSTKQLLLTEHNNQGQTIGRTEEYLTVVIDKKLKLGEKVLVKITDTNISYLSGKGIRYYQKQINKPLIKKKY